jgi:hypothetical protein
MEIVHVRLYVLPLVMLRTPSAVGILLAGRGIGGDLFNIILAAA